jgi:prophage DNA circulation protein
MSTILDIQTPWRDLLLTPASFRRVMFHVETGARLSGRRTVVHEYPKRDDPYAEDMGRQAKRFHFSAYLIYRPLSLDFDYVTQRDALVEALEQDGPGPLVHPVFARPEQGTVMVMVERYTMVENRQRGGFTEFELQMVELGKPGNSLLGVNTLSVLGNNSTTSETSAANISFPSGSFG